MKKILRIWFVVLTLFAVTNVACAVPPPDFIFNVGAQIVQIFSIVALFLSAALASASQFAKLYFARVKNKVFVWSGLIVLMLTISAGAAYFYGNYAQNEAYNDWLAQSKIQNQDTSATDTSLDALTLGDTTQSSHANRPRPIENKYVSFIRQYYQNLSSGNVQAAYEVSKKSVPLATYQGWYKNVTSVVVDDIQAIDKKKYSLSLTLIDAGVRTRYGVLMTLHEADDGALTIADSQVRVLSDNEINSPSTVVEEDRPNTVFFANNSTVDLSISNEEFRNTYNANNKIFILDAREDEEYEIGRFPGSTHIRFADLLAGEWIALPTDRPIYVFCWSGIRGKEVATFLRSKKILGRYVQNGADGWVSYGGLWQGGIKFLSQYSDARYTRLFTIDELKQKMVEGTVIVDSRMSSHFQSWHIPGSVNIPTIYTPTSRMEEALAQVPAGASVITVCDDFVSCFDAKVTGVKLEKKGHAFLGRYNKPWEYRSSK